jgi:hypothetical protein
VTLQGWTPNDASLLQYKSYSFSASAADLNIGGAITEFQWDFGDGTKLVRPATLANGQATDAYAYAYATSGNFTVSVVSKNAAGLLSTASTRAVTVSTAPSPLTVAFTAPAGPVTINPPLGGSYSLAFDVHVTNAGTGTISAGGVVLTSGDAGSIQAAPVDLGSGDWRITVTYPAGVLGSRTVTPSVRVQDSNGVSSAVTTGPVVTIKTVALVNSPPVINLTTPATDNTVSWTSKPFSLGFTLNDADNDPVTYTVDWGDGQPVSSPATPTGDFVAGVPVSVTHTYADAFTSTSKGVTITVTASDNRSTVTKTRLVTVKFNALPTATIITPQASGTAPTGLQAGITPPYVVIPRNGRLTFAGSSTLPGSQDPVTTSWTFPGGAPSTFTGDAPGDVTFGGTQGVITPAAVIYSVKDAFGRTVTATKLVLVDGINTQQFTLSFQYRQKSDNNGVAVLAPVVTAANGLGAAVQVFQDGQANTYQVQDQAQLAGAKATVSIPVRSDLPFYIKIPSFGGDTNGYMMRIPNAPTGPYADPALGTTLDPNSTVSNFGFQNSAAPLNPTLNIVTAQGFAAENAVTNLRTINGATSLFGGTSPANERWLSRLSVPVSDVATSALPGAWAWSSQPTVTNTGGFSAYQAFADWAVMLKTLATSDPTAPGKSGDLEFKLDYETYKTSSAVSKSFAASAMQAFRVPKGVTSPYDLDNAGWGRASALSDLNPTPVDGSIPFFFKNAAFGAVGNSTLAGGLQGLSIPYDPTDTADRVVMPAPTSRDFSNIVRLFGYSEYLWTKVWSWPLVLNTALLNSPDTESLSAYGHFRFSDPLHATPTPSHWPSVLTGISPSDPSSFSLNANGGTDFDPSGSPVGDTTVAGAPSAKASGHFYWTVFSPFYSSSGASIIARTWLAQGTNLSDPTVTYPGQPPTLFSGGATDATSAFGFVPPQDTVVDKRTRKLDGTIDYSVSSLNGYRVNWFNPTKDASGNPVAPDFWVIELNVGGTKSHFMLPGNFPASYPAVTVDPATMPILTDARTVLLHPADSTPLSGKAVVAPGYCWFDVPLELRPPTGSATTTLTVYAVKSVLSNHAPAGARPLNRPEWIEAIKTASAAISLKTNAGIDLSNVYKIPFNYYWDIVITNGPITTVAQ